MNEQTKQMLPELLRNNPTSRNVAVTTPRLIVRFYHDTISRYIHTNININIYIIYIYILTMYTYVVSSYF